MIITMLTELLTIYFLGVLVLAGIYYLGLRSRHIHLWLPYYLARRRRLAKQEKPVLRHVMFCFVDHYEPLVGEADVAAGLRRVKRWTEKYPSIADKHIDADGRHLRHSFFYPEEEYREVLMDELAGLCRRGYGEVEIHLHHDNDTEQNFVQRMRRFIGILAERYGMLPRRDGKPCFAFIHGDWALDNSRQDGRCCGLNNELTLLRELGCYADFTMPSGTSETQTRLVNEVYYATDDPDRPKSYDSGELVQCNEAKNGDLLMISGPLALNWKYRKLGIWPRVEDADVTPTDIPLEERVDLWVEQAIHVHGRSDWLFVKVHTHGANEVNSEFLFEDGALDQLCTYLERQYNDGSRYRLHYVTARETYNIIKAAEAGMEGDPGQYRDYVLAPPF